MLPASRNFLHKVNAIYVCSTRCVRSAENVFAGTVLLSQQPWGLGRALATEIKVPSMGDSITDGIIASIFKTTGDICEEDESILQIETDKVAVDVRAPTMGTLRALLVKQEDVVTVGQVLAVLDTENAALAQSRNTKESPGATEGAQPAAVKPDQDALSVAAYDKQDSTMRGHKAHISFPPRRTSDGKVISAMPRWDQQTYIDRSVAASHSMEPPPSSGGSPAQHETREAARDRATSQPPPRRVIPEFEIEAIMLGGADP